MYPQYINVIILSQAPVVLTPVIPATQEAEIRRIKFRSQPRQIVCKTLSGKKINTKKSCGVAQDAGPEFKP
jgi:hypothetical protein